MNSMREMVLNGESGAANPANDNPYHQDNWELVAVGDWLAGQRFEITRHAVLGRDSSCDITIPGTHLSRHHAELAVKGGNLLIRDLKSSNGTFVNEQRVTETSLKPGDMVRFDVLTFKVHGPSADQQPDATKTQSTLIRQPPSAAQPKPAARKANASDKQWKTRPTSVGNRDRTIVMTAAQKATSKLWTLLAVVLVLATVAGIGYLITYL